MVVKELENTYAIWTRDNGLGVVVCTTEENGRIEYHIIWQDGKDDVPVIYGPEDIEDGNLLIIQGRFEVIQTLYGQKS